MKQQRREVLRLGTALGLALSAGLLSARDVFGAQWKQAVYDAKTLDEALKALGGTSSASTSALIAINAPDIAENGAVVPVSVNSSAANTQMIAILVEKNPAMMAAQFTIMPGTEPAITTRIKMNGTSNVLALVKADDKWLLASKEIKVTLGGCGG
jgi:sulfur-oxidizing protein SoxY